MNNKKKIAKLMISILLFIMGTVASIFTAVYMHLFLSNSLSGLEIVSLFTAIRLVISEPKARYIFFILESGVVLLSIGYCCMQDTLYKSQLIKITPAIEIPKPAGQGQFGSAWFVSAKERPDLFTVCDIKKKDKRIKKLMAFGKEQYKSIKNIDTEGGAEHIATFWQIFQKGRRRGGRDERKDEKKI